MTDADREDAAIMARVEGLRAAAAPHQPQKWERDLARYRAVVAERDALAAEVERLRAYINRATAGARVLWEQDESVEDSMPYPNEPARTHWVGCWRSPGHHNCAVREADELRTEVERLRRLLAPVPDSIDLPDQEIGAACDAWVPPEPFLVVCQTHWVGWTRERGPACPVAAAVAKAVAAEREACAALADKWARDYRSDEFSTWAESVEMVADAIRERGKEPTDV